MKTNIYNNVPCVASLHDAKYGKFKIRSKKDARRFLDESLCDCVSRYRYKQDAYEIVKDGDKKSIGVYMGEPNMFTPVLILATNEQNDSNGNTIYDLVYKIRKGINSYWFDD